MTSSPTTVTSSRTDKHLLSEWNPEDPQQWKSRQAWLTLWVTTFSLLLGFMVWFVVSSLAPMLQNAAVVDKTEAFWLTSMPGLAGGLLRLLWMFLPPMMGTRRMVVWSTAALMLPMAGWAWLLTMPAATLDDSFGMMMVLAFLTGIGGGVFSGYMPSTSYFFPKRLQGTALGIQAGMGNFGVAVVQLLTPILIGIGFFGAALKIPTAKEPDKVGFLQTAPAFILGLLVISFVLAIAVLKSVPIKANVRQQMDIFRNKHTWLMTLLYMLTFGCFSGLAGTFGLMLNQMVPSVPTIAWLGGAPIAFLGAFVGSVSRVLWGPLCDKYGGGIWTLISSIGIGIASVIVIVSLSQTQLLENVPANQVAKCEVPLGLFLIGMFTLFFFAGVGNASTFKQMPMIFEPRQAGGVIGWTAAIAAFGPFIFSWTMNMLSGTTGNFGVKIIPVFVAVLVLAIACTVITYWYYWRRGAEAKS